MSGRPFEVADDQTIRLLDEGEDALLPTVDGMGLARSFPGWAKL